MLKIKALLWGVLLSIGLFIFLLVLLIFISFKTGILDEAVYNNLLIFFASLSLFSGGFTAAKAAGEKALIYGMINAAAVLILFSILFFSLNNGFDSGYLFKGLMILAASLLGSVSSLFSVKKSPYV